MAKGKKASGKTYVSKGERRSSMKTANMHTSADRMLYKMDALSKGKNVYFTIANPNKAETNKPFVKIKMIGRDWVKRRQGGGFQMKEEEV